MNSWTLNRKRNDTALFRPQFSPRSYLWVERSHQVQPIDSKCKWAGRFQSRYPADFLVLQLIKNVHILQRNHSGHTFFRWKLAFLEEMLEDESPYAQFICQNNRVRQVAFEREIFRTKDPMTSWHISALPLFGVATSSNLRLIFAPGCCSKNIYIWFAGQLKARKAVFVHILCFIHTMFRYSQFLDSWSICVSMFPFFRTFPLLCASDRACILQLMDFFCILHPAVSHCNLSIHIVGKKIPHC